MKLLGTLYEIVALDPEQGRAQLRLIPDCVIYRAHFPEMPVTPGVCIIAIALEIASQFRDTPLLLAEVVNAKFLSLIDPRVNPDVTYDVTFRPESSGLLKANVVVSAAATVFTKLSLLLKE